MQLFCYDKTSNLPHSSLAFTELLLQLLWPCFQQFLSQFVVPVIQTQKWNKFAEMRTTMRSWGSKTSLSWTDTWGPTIRWVQRGNELWEREGEIKENQTAGKSSSETLMYAQFFQYFASLVQKKDQKGFWCEDLALQSIC